MAQRRRKARAAARVAQRSADKAAKGGPERWKLPLHHDATGGFIFDADNQMVAELRGWGHLTVGLGLSTEEAIAVQTARGEALVAALNAATKT